MNPVVRSVITAITLAMCTTGYSQNGWTDLKQFLVPSQGSRSLGNPALSFNNTRDRGSKIVFFNNQTGDNATAQVYWWDGARIVDGAGSPTDGSGRAYGTNPLQPDESAIKPFKQAIGVVGNAVGDPRLRVHGGQMFAVVAGGYPDWFLFRRGQRHDTFDGGLDGGRSETEPMVIAAYGPPSAGRAVIDPAIGTQVTYSGQQRPVINPFEVGLSGETAVWLHEVLVGLELRESLVHLGTNTAVSLGGGVPTLLVEDCKLINASMFYLPRKSTVRRSVVAFRWDAGHHNQGYYSSDFVASTTFDEVIFYKNGYKTDPRTDPDPVRDVFCRNIYQGGGAQMGHTYRNIISADGASGGPQMRLGGLCENSLIVEGYWFSSTESNSVENSWLTATRQTGRSTIVRDNVQLVFCYPSPKDPDTDDRSSIAAQAGSGYTMQGASFGSVVENNIVSLAMLSDDLGVMDTSLADGYVLNPGYYQYEDGNFYTFKNDTIRGNIAYRTQNGLALLDNWTAAAGVVVENNIFVSPMAISNGSTGLDGSSQLVIRNNRFYTRSALPISKTWMGANNVVRPFAAAATNEAWSDPNRTLKRYVTEVAGLTLLDWQDEPGLNPEAVAARVAAREAYDPTGLKTFMAVATNMRNGGTAAVPASGKPSWSGDYAWNDRFTGVAVVNWIREGFGKSAIAAGIVPPSRATASRRVTVWSRSSLSGGCAVSFQAAVGSRVSFTIRDLRGRTLRHLGTHTAGSGVGTVLWDGRDETGVSAGRQICVLEYTINGGTHIAQTMPLVRR